MKNKILTTAVVVVTAFVSGLLVWHVKPASPPPPPEIITITRTDTLPADTNSIIAQAREGWVENDPALLKKMFGEVDTVYLDTMPGLLPVIETRVDTPVVLKESSAWEVNFNLTVQQTTLLSSPPRANMELIIGEVEHVSHDTTRIITHGVTDEPQKWWRKPVAVFTGGCATGVITAVVVIKLAVELIKAGGA